LRDIHENNFQENECDDQRNNDCYNVCHQPLSLAFDNPIVENPEDFNDQKKPECKLCQAEIPAVALWKTRIVKFDMKFIGVKKKDENEA
jgi:hypothetical protein